MAKRGKSRKKKIKRSAPSRKMVQEIREAMDRFENGTEEEKRDAYRKIEGFYKKRPRDPLLISCMLDLSVDYENWFDYIYFGERLLPYEEGYEKSRILQNLAAFCNQLFYPAMAWRFGRQLADELPAFAEEAQLEMINMLEEGLLEQAAELPDMAGLPPDEQLELMVANDRMRFYTTSPRTSAEGVTYGKEILKKWPGLKLFANNLSLTQFLAGDIDAAEKTALGVLEQDPQNFQALGNLLRFNFLTGRIDEAEAYKAQLLAIPPEDAHFDLPLKQMEALALLGDGEKIVEIFEQGEGKRHVVVSQTQLLYHLAAAAYYQIGQEEKAWPLWEESLTHDPDFEMAKSALAEKELNYYDRDLPWYYSFPYWFAGDIVQEFSEAYEQLDTHSEEEGERVFQRLLKKRPYLPQLVPHMLARGDQQTREFAAQVISMLDSPEMHAVGIDFARSDQGPDTFRWNLLSDLTAEHPELLPADQMVTMWSQGRAEPVFMPSFHVSLESPAGRMPAARKAVLEKARALQANEEVREAIALLEEEIAAHLEYESTYSLLSMFYNTEEMPEARAALIDKGLSRFPDHILFNIAKAEMLVESGAYAEAESRLAPIIARTTLGYGEFQRLAQASIELNEALGRPERTVIWFELWEELTPESSMFNYMQAKIQFDRGEYE